MIIARGLERLQWHVLTSLATFMPEVWSTSQPMFPACPPQTVGSKHCVCPSSGCTWSPGSQISHSQHQAPPVLLHQAHRLELQWRLRYPGLGHEMEDCVGHLPAGGALPDHRCNRVQGPGEATWELAEVRHLEGEAGVPGPPLLRQLVRAGGPGEGGWLDSDFDSFGTTFMDFLYTGNKLGGTIEGYLVPSEVILLMTVNVLLWT